MTTTSSSFYSSVQSPASRVPYDVLREIFIHCLPQRRFREQQPEPRIAPMLLCQICSSWRTVALNSATLWSHLSYVFLIEEDGSDNSWKTPRDHLKFLSWWRRNQGTMAPSLCIKLKSTPWYRNSTHPIPDSELEAVDIMPLVQYIASARYLEADDAIWRLIYKWSDQEVYPNPHTLVKSELYAEEFSYFYFSQRYMPNHTFSALRYLYLWRGTLQCGRKVIPNAWSKLTHIALDHFTVTLNAWLNFIRSFPDLEWGSFDIILCHHGHTQYSGCTLPRLLELHVSHLLDEDWDVPELEFPLSTLLTNLHLPALHTLTLHSKEDSWRDQRVISDLYRVLNSTPAITTLILGFAFLSLGRDYHIRPEIGNVEPCWRLATHLAHLQLNFSFGWTEGMEERIRKNIIESIFHPDSRWLDLHDPACTIQKISLIHYGSKYRCQFLNNYTMSRVREHLEKAPNVNVVFDTQVTDEDYNDTATGEWNEWGPNI